MDNEGKDPKALTVAQAGGLMTGLILLSRILGQVRDTIISYKFGQVAITDAYRAAFSVIHLSERRRRAYAWRRPFASSPIL